MGPDVDKLFLLLAGRPVVAHTWLRFDALPEFEEIILVVRDGMQPSFKEMGATLPLMKPWQLVAGGAERQDSVWHGLEALKPRTEVVAIQDGARPCTPESVIRQTLAAARQHGAAVAAQRVTDTIKESEDGASVARHLDRSRLWAVQTPQCFRVEVIRKALAAVRGKGLRVTDDTAACELIGQQVRLIESGIANPKVTVAGDVPYLEMLLREGATKK
jgi:2-C-methyl-D-erythritol 4-phosphate cytidylyltransferase